MSENSGLPILKAAKRSVLRSLEGMGVSDSVRDSGWRRKRLAILCYHGVSIEDEHEWDPALFVSQEFLARRMEQVERGGYNVLPLDEAVSRLYENTLPPRSVAITFDDGNHDFLARALPVLRSHDFPATVYLTTYYSDNNLPVFDVGVRYILWKGKHNLERLTEFHSTRETPTSVNRTELSNQIIQHAKARGWSAERKDEFLRQMAQALNVDYQTIVTKKILHIMTPDEVREIAEAGVSVQLHTHRHRTPSARSLFLRELTDNRLRIETITGSAPSHFCYPNGFFRPEFFPWLREAGISSATTTRTGLASPRTEPLLLPRIVDHAGLSPAEFEGWLSGAAVGLPHRFSQARTQ